MARTLDNFQQLAQEVATMGAQYNPAAAALKVMNLTTQHTAAKAATMGVVSAASGAYKNPVNARKEAHTALKKMPGPIRNEGYDEPAELRGDNGALRQPD